MNNLAIQTHLLSKQYAIGVEQKQYKRFGDKLADIVVAPMKRLGNLVRGNVGAAAQLEDEIWALKDISLEIKRGEVVGIIGRNGAGKSTLLKILSRITVPTSGEAFIYGRVGSLLEVGTGFHPELTGRENVYLNGAILGMKRGEISRKFDEIVDFAEISKFIDTPVKHYSSGMYVRLAFSVAAHLEPEILMVDEVLAVGDLAFQRKCLGKMDDVAQQGRTILFVSHNMGLLQQLCHRGVFIHQGEQVFDGPIDDAVNAYLQTLEEVHEQNIGERVDREGRGLVRLTAVEILNNNSEPTTTLTSGAPASFVFHVNGVLPRLSCVFTLFNQVGQRVAVFKSDTRAPGDQFINSNDIRFICEVDELLLLPGRYRMNVLIRGGGEWQDNVEAAAIFDVHPGLVRGRAANPHREISILIPHQWSTPVES